MPRLYRMTSLSSYLNSDPLASAFLAASIASSTSWFTVDSFFYIRNTLTKFLFQTRSIAHLNNMYKENTGEKAHTLLSSFLLLIFPIMLLRPSWESSGWSARPSSKSTILAQFARISSGVSFLFTGKPWPPDLCHLVRPTHPLPTSKRPPVGGFGTLSLQRSTTRGAM